MSDAQTDRYYIDLFIYIDYHINIADNIIDSVMKKFGLSDCLISRIQATHCKNYLCPLTTVNSVNSVLQWTWLLFTPQLRFLVCI